MNELPESVYVKPRDVMRYLGVSRWQLRRWVDAGILTPQYPGRPGGRRLAAGYMRFLRSEVMEKLVGEPTEECDG